MPEGAAASPAGRLVARALERLAENSRDLWLPRAVPRRPIADVRPLEFLRDFVARSQPVVLTRLPADEWPCLDRWSEAYLLEAVGSAEVSVSVSAAGLGDFVDEAGRFVKPLEERMPFRDFWAWLATGRAPAGGGQGVPYLSRQNDSLREELPGLLRDVPAAVALGVAAFGNEPEAVNLWVGDERSVSSCHKDHYENLYTVVRGEKVFTLLPPSMAAFLHERRCPPAHFERPPPGARDGQSALVVVPDGDAPAGGVPWVPVDVAKPDLVRFPDYARACAVRVRVRPGEMLYLPAMWYHQVEQRGLTVAVNYWHDMQFDHAYVHHRFLRDVAGLDAPDVEGEEAAGDGEGPASSGPGPPGARE
uniref:JmjC domain-containing protein n=1 Tax=Alexandrium monilatum TaxID=311494 RepID=A0A7S4PT93_9DINO